MRFRTLVKRPDVIIAALAFFLLSWGTASGFNTIVERQGRNVIIDEPLHPGTRTFLIKTPEGCGGWVSSTLDDSGSQVEFRLRGALAAKAGTLRTRLKLQGESIFTAGGQLASAYIRAQNDDPPSIDPVTMVLSFVEIDPIKATLAVKKGNVVSSKEAILPGPFELRRIGLESYRLSYGPLRDSRSELGLGLLHRLQSMLRLQIEEFNGPEEQASNSCAKEVEIDLSGLFSLLDSAASILPPR